MNRSSRVRKPSQKAREIAEAMLSRSNSSSSADPAKAFKSNLKSRGTSRARKQSRSMAATAKVKIGRKQGRATVNSDGDVDVEEFNDYQDFDDVDDEEEDEDALYCICLGHDDHTPMIQCEGCDNWFHFSCIQLDPSEAQEIEAFYCEVCQASGTGITRKIDEENTAHDTIPSETAEPLPACDPNSDQEEVYESSETKGCPARLNPNLKIDAIVVQTCSAAQAPDSEQSTHSPASQAMQASSSNEGAKGIEVAQEQRGSCGIARSSPSSKATHRRQRKAEGLSSEGEDITDDEFTGEEALIANARKRKTPTSTDPRRPTHLRLTSTTPSNTTPSTPTTPVTGPDKTRKACVDQFFKLFEPIFAQRLSQIEALNQTEGVKSGEAAMEFAEDVETELFESFGEADAKNQKAPRRQYMTKFRSLLFNLKHNPTLLSGLSSSEISPKLIVHMSNQDLQTPELKALADQIRQRSLHDSVRTMISVPKAKITHKGEETIEGASSLKSANDGAAEFYSTTPQHLEFDSTPGLESISLPASSTSHANPLTQVSAASRSPVLGQSVPCNPHKADQNAVDHNKGLESTSAASTGPQESISRSLVPDMLTTFDLESVFAAIRSVPATLSVAANGVATGAQQADEESQAQAKDGSDESMDLENTPERELADEQGTGGPDGQKTLPDDYDPFLVANGADADLDAILHGDQPTTPPAPSNHPIPARPAETELPRLATHPSAYVEPIQKPVVWMGNVMTADAGGFAACAVQVGGRTLSTDHITWGRLIPGDTMTVVGRLPVKDSSNYLVQSHFAASRELVLLELRPNLQGPPDLPSPERVTQHQQNLIEFFTKKGRHAVVSVNEKVKQTVRDIYLVPLLRDEPLPEFVQLLDEVSIPERTPRAKDIILAVLVLQKGVIPSPWNPNPQSSLGPASNQAVASAGIAPPAVQAAPIQRSHFSGQGPSSSTHPTAALLAPLPFPISQNSSSMTPSSSSGTMHTVDPIPLLQSLTSKISSVAPQLPLSLLSQLPLPVTSAAPGPPPGFVPYVPPPASLPHIPPTPAPSTALDLSKLDVSALQALLSSQQVLKPAPNPAPPQPVPPSYQNHNPTPTGYRHGSQNSNSVSHSTAHHHTPQNLNPVPHAAAHRYSSHDSHAGSQSTSYRNTSYGSGLSSRPSTLPPTPRPVNLPANPHQSAWTGERSPRSAEGRDKRKGLMRMGEVLRGTDERRRADGERAGVGRPKRMSQEFVAPHRDDGWAGRGRTRSRGGGGGHHHGGGGAGGGSGGGGGGGQDQFRLAGGHQQMGADHHQMYSQHSVWTDGR